jgi:hypothetical protein
MFANLKLGFGSDPYLNSSKRLDPDPHIMNADPKHFSKVLVPILYKLQTGREMQEILPLSD